jgi:LacI family transcriptional regulator
MSERVTLKTIANVLGVTTTTVHRALNGKDGISEETRAEVRRVAESMGYRVNYMAAALKHKVIRIAIALPEPVGDNRYYYTGVWMGVRRFLSESADFNVVPLEYSYRFVYGANGNALKNIYEQHADKLDGVLTMGVDQGHSSYYINKLKEQKVPIVLLGSDMYKDARFCCVRACDEMAGSLAAELMASFGGHEPKKVIVAGHFGQLGMTDQLRNVSGFENYLKENAPNITPVHVRNEDPVAWAREMERIFEREGDICAVYSCSARYTVYLSEFLVRSGLSGKLKAIGSDIFAESIRFLQSGALSAVIDKKIARQSYLAAKTLFDYAVKGELPRSDVLQVRPEVVLRNSLSLAGRDPAGLGVNMFDDIL